MLYQNVYIPNRGLEKMGMINITLAGSFGNNGSTFRAQKSGHAQAVREAINWLSGEILKKAIEQDHQLQFDNIFPDDSFNIKKGDIS